MIERILTGILIGTAGGYAVGEFLAGKLAELNAAFAVAGLG